MIIFNADLDNTLIYSKKHDIGRDKRCVEIYQDEEFCFMTSKSLGLLERINNKILFVPTTTRSVEQYNRISFGNIVPKYALVCNGGVLIEDGNEDDGWYRESLKLIASCEEELEKARKIMQEDIHRSFEVRFIKKLFIFTKSDKPEIMIMKLKENIDSDKLDIYRHGSKVYAVPKALSKGNAVLRLKNRLGADSLICAGDSYFDESMLMAAELSFAPEFMKIEKDNHVSVPADRIFSDEILSYIVENYL
ncbi:MAG: HAD hydrolase family protein [Firmicutes bacterium]|nr:HAD hydrolase family protein [Bacillota bacterium]